MLWIQRINAQPRPFGLLDCAFDAVKGVDPQFRVGLENMLRKFHFRPIIFAVIKSDPLCRPINARRIVGKKNHNPREHRGALLSTADGITLIGVSPHPSWYISMTYLGRAYYSDSILTAFSVVSRNEYVGRRRASRCAFELLPQRSADILPVARQAGVRRSLSDVPEVIRELIEPAFS